MRLDSTFFRARSYASAPQGPLSDPAAGEAGYEGDRWLADMQGGGPDVNPELSGSRKFDVFDEMAKTDPAVKSLEFFLKLPIRSAVWGLEPANDDPVSMVVRDFVSWNLGLGDDEGELDLSWDETLQQGLSILRYGPCIEELVWDDVRGWRDKDGDEHLVRPLTRLALRPARTIGKVKRRGGRIVSVEQELSSSSVIPGEKVSYMVFEREANRWDGVSLLRPAWGAWRSKKALTIASGIGWDRFASGLPVIWHPDNEDAEERAKRIGRGVRQHERGYVHFPTDGPGQSGSGRPESGWFMELLNGASTLADPTPLLRHFSAEIAEAGLQQFSKLGTTETGSRAVAEVQIDPFFLAVQALAHYVRRERSRQVIRKLVEVNFGVEAAERFTPRLTVSKIQARSVAVIARAIADLSTAGFTFTELSDHNDVRELIGFEKLPDDGSLEARGVDRARLQAILAGAGLDQAQLAAIVAQLPPDVGVARNRVPGEGNGLPVPA